MSHTLVTQSGRSTSAATSLQLVHSLRRWLLFALLTGALACFIQCGPPASGDGLTFCDSGADCPQGTECSMNTCIRVPGFRSDGGLVDVQPPDDRPPVERGIPEVRPESTPEPPTETGGCQSDSDCTPNTHICLQGKCVEGCRETKQCPAGQLCKANQCAGCSSDNECPNNQLCDAALCKPGNCRVSADCAGGQVCKGNMCSACTQNTECSKGICLNGVCAPDSCKDRNDCPTGLICVSNKCGNCDKHGDCDNNEVCDNGICRVGDCIMREECPKGEVCKKNTCEKCADKSDCQSDEVCDAGHCKVGNCIDRGQCSGGLICKKNTCDKCADKGDCQSNEVCDAGFCKVGNCVAKGDCKSEEVCKNFQCGPCTASLDCGSGYVCDTGACKAGDCLVSTDCANGLICKALKCEACTLNSECPTTLPFCVGGVCKSSGIALVSSNDGLRWADTTYAKDCSEYKTPPAGYEPGTKDAVYWIKPSGVRNPFRVHCNMSYQGGGWTLLLKTKGGSSIWAYYSRWKSSSTIYTYHPDFDLNEAKLESYSTVPFKEILLQFRDPITSTNANDLRSLIIKKTASSMLSIMNGKDNQSFDTPIGRSGWEGLVSSPSLEPNCNREGFNLKSGGGDGQLLRLGIQTGDKSDCSDTDSYIGIGSNNYRVYAGNWAKNTTNNGNRSTRVFAYVYVRTP